ncbi:MAG: Lrp/AsnC family transcriptional regulator [Candidatus Zixiibacteriota bacterium]
MTERNLIDTAAKGLTIEAAPFKPLAEHFGVSEEEILESLRRMIREGKVKRFAASVRHQPLGYHFNAMILARTDEKNLERVGFAVSKFPAVSHCYQRSHPDGDPWCIYIMIHGREKEKVERIVEEIRRVRGIIGMEVCTSLLELKKTSLSGISSHLEKPEAPVTTPPLADKENRFATASARSAPSERN